jgi:hypothetical protein
MTYHRRNGAEPKAGTTRCAPHTNITSRTRAIQYGLYSFIAPSSQYKRCDGQLSDEHSGQARPQLSAQCGGSLSVGFRTETGGGLYQLSCREPSVSAEHDRDRGQSFRHQRRTGRSKDFPHRRPATFIETQLDARLRSCRTKMRMIKTTNIIPTWQGHCRHRTRIRR